MMDDGRKSDGGGRFDEAAVAAAIPCFLYYMSKKWSRRYDYPPTPLPNSLLLVILVPYLNWELVRNNNNNHNTNNGGDDGNFGEGVWRFGWLAGGRAGGAKDF